MFRRIGKKIQVIGMIIGWGGIGCGALYTLIMLIIAVRYDDYYAYFAMLGTPGAIVFLVTGWFIYGFGELIERTTSADDLLGELAARLDRGITVRTMTEKAEEDERRREELAGAYERRRQEVAEEDERRRGAQAEADIRLRSEQTKSENMKKAASDKLTDFKIIPGMKCEACEKSGVPLAFFSNFNGTGKMVWLCEDCAKTANNN